MIETIPNPLDDKGIQKEIEEKVSAMMEYKKGCFNISDFTRNLLMLAAKWGISYGFRLGWRVYENTHGKI